MVLFFFSFGCQLRFPHYDMFCAWVYEGLDFFLSTLYYLPSCTVPLCHDISLCFYSYFPDCMYLLFCPHTLPLDMNMSIDVLGSVVRDLGNCSCLCSLQDCGTGFRYVLAVSWFFCCFSFCARLCFYALSFRPSFGVAVISGPVNLARFAAVHWLLYFHLGFPLL